MKRVRLTAFLWVCILASNALHAQNPALEFDSDTAFYSFLLRQGEVNGLRSFVKIPQDTVLDESISTLFNPTSDLLRSKSFVSFDSTAALLSLMGLEMSSERLGWEVYGQLSEIEVAQQFVSNLLQSEVIFPATDELDKDYIGLASRRQYQPLFKDGFGFFTSFKIFLISVIITLFFLMATTMIIFMVVFKSRRNRLEALELEYEKQIADPLSVFLFEWNSEQIQEISAQNLDEFFPKEKMKKELYRKVLIDQIIRLSKKLRGDSNTKLRVLFRKLELPKTTAELLNEKQWDSKVSALVQINEMALMEFLPAVREQVNSANFYIRSQATTTLLHLSEEVNLSFLTELSYPLSEWQQMNLVRTIKYLYSDRKLHIDALFTAENDSVRLFGIKLVRHLGRIDYLERILSLVESNKPDELLEIIETFKQVGAPLQLDKISKFMQHEDPKVRLSMAGAIGTVGDESSMPLIYQALNASPNFETKRALLSSMKALSLGGYLEYVYIAKDEEVSRIQHHLDNNLLTHV